MLPDSTKIALSFKQAFNDFKSHMKSESQNTYKKQFKRDKFAAKIVGKSNSTIKSFSETKHEVLARQSKLFLSDVTLLDFF